MNMRRPGYNQEQIWDYGAEVLFDGVDYGDGLLLEALTFAPAPPTGQMITLPGISGKIDVADAQGLPKTYGNIPATITLAIKRSAESQWLSWAGPGTIEGRFLSAVNGKICSIEFKNSNRFCLRGRVTVKSYTRFDLIWRIVLSVDADPFWWHKDGGAMEWAPQAATNIINDLYGGVDTTRQSGTDVAISYNGNAGSADHRYVRVVLRANPGGYGTIKFTGLTASHTYCANFRVTQAPGEWAVYDAAGNKFDSPANITGVTTLYVRFTSYASDLVAVAFVDGAIYDHADGSPVWVSTLDAPVYTMDYWSSVPATLFMGGETYDIRGGEGKIYGLNVPPRTTMYGVVMSTMQGYGYATYKKGAFGCTE